jgi:phosphate transport system protein
MRAEYQAELDRLIDALDTMAELVEHALDTATTALLRADSALADSVLATADQADAAQREIDQHAVGLIARQQPVATDLRAIIAYLRASTDLERMGVLATHIAEIAAQRHPAHAVPPELADIVGQMGALGHRLVGHTRQAIRSDNCAARLSPSRIDDEVDALQRKLYQRVLDPTSPYTPATVFDLALIGRYYERYADHAVSVSHRMAYRAGTTPLDS